MGVLILCCENCGYFYFDDLFHGHHDENQMDHRGNILSYKCTKSNDFNVKKLHKVWNEDINFRYLSSRIYHYHMDEFNYNLVRLTNNIDDDKIVKELVVYFKKCYY